MKAKLLSITMSLIMCFCVSAQNPEFNFIEQDELPYTFIEQNGLIYQILEEPSEGNAFGKVSLYSWTIGGDEYKYKGDIVIPTAIQNGDGDFADKYRVYALGYHLFDNCDELQSVTFPENRNGIYIYGQTFKNTPKLKSVKFPNPDKGPGAFNSIDPEAFLNSGIEEIIIPEEVKSIGYDAFKGSKLKHITLPVSIKEIGDEAFAETPITNITFSSALRDGNYRDGVFNNCSKLNEIIFLEPIEKIPTGFFRNIQSDSLSIKGDIKELGKACFDGCKFNSIRLPQTIEVIESRCFNDCSNLQSIELPEGLRILRTDAFRGSGIKTITVPKDIDMIEEYGLGDPSDIEKILIKCSTDKIPTIYLFLDRDFTIPRNKVIEIK